MSLTDQLFSCLESKGTDSKGRNSECRSKSGQRIQICWTEQDEQRNNSGGGCAKAGRSSQELDMFEDLPDSAYYGRNDYGHQNHDIGGGRNDRDDSVPIGGRVTSGRGSERRSSSVSSGRESQYRTIDDDQHIKCDRSGAQHSSRPDIHPRRNNEKHGGLHSKSGKNIPDEHCKQSYWTEEWCSSGKDYPGSRERKRKFDDISKIHSHESHNDMPKEKLQTDRKHVKSRTAQNSADGFEHSIAGKYGNGTRNTVKKRIKINDYTDDVPFKIINFRKLEDLVNGNPMELVVALANRHSGFENRLKEKLSPDFIMLVVKALAKLCKADFHENKVAILSHACEADFLNQISDYLMKLPFESDENRKSKMDEFFFDILTLYKTTMDLLPDKACDKLPNMLETMERAMRCIEACQAKTFPDGLNEGLLDLDCRLKVRINERETRHKKPICGNAVGEETPPNNFREISLYPKSGDILNSDPTFIRPNIVKGAYSSVEHYLDVQFRLLREDFVCPLREGITDYMSNTMADGRRKKRINNVRIYRKAMFIAPKVVKDAVGLEVCFDSSNYCSKVKWDHNRRFMFGSLLCFTNDNFVNIFFATVVERDVAALKKGRITVDLHNVDHLTDDMFQSNFIMVESEVYFEPYFHVLQALQKLKVDNFPMRQYIVDVDVRSAPPLYLQSQPDFKYNIDDHNVAVLDDATWPSAEKLHLDDSQYVAFKSALTKEFVVIQGPPGTGKTYIGLKIAEILLRNSPIWNASNKPILVVCYTNHALDQFLEGIMVHTKDIVRIGGQSKSEVLKEFNLKELRRKNVLNADVSMLMRDIHNHTSCMMKDIKHIQVDLESINSGKGVISLHTLRVVGIPSRHLCNFFTSDGEIDDDVFVEWLKIGMQYCDEPEFYNMKQSEDNGRNTETPETKSTDLEGDPNEGIWQHAFDDPIEFSFDTVNIVTHVRYAFVLDKLQEYISILYQKRAQIDASTHPALMMECFHLDRKIQEYHRCMNYWQNCVQNSRCCDGTVERLLLSENLWQLSPNERWIIYHHWVNNLKKRMFNDLRTLEHEVRTSAKRYEEVKEVGDLHMMQKALVIGMTTSGAARLQPLLQSLKPRIVIVEEAAEVLESHIIVSLTSDCQHLILIGDHKQLRPSTAVYKLAREYKFDISLFERMLTNGMHCETLKVQHRMRPEIAQLIVPTIYPELYNHESVLKQKQIEGTTKSVYFVTHNNPEEEVEDSQSRRNIHEARFLVALARHLVLQGYYPEQITMLTTYKGQMFFLRSEAKLYLSLAGMKITVVDNYQGEENDIVLLSLVRSNKEAVIGFLKTENRVCVALSRAKIGFFIIGNMNNLTRSSTIWPKIKETLDKQEAIGSHLTLRCQLHTAQFTKVACAEDFHNVPEGGCCLPCNAEMVCGHTCKSVCHVLNREHTEYKCLEPCRRVPENCPVEHVCLKQCWEYCNVCMTLVEKVLPCGHVLNLPCHVDSEKYECQEKVTVTMPDCEHEVTKPCYISVDHFRCNHPCEDRLPCGHSCEGLCHYRTDPDHAKFKCYKPCAKNNTGCSMDHPCQKRCFDKCMDCDVIVKKKLPGCEHVHSVKCSVDPVTVECNRRCQRMLDCGHPCPKKCNEQCGGCSVKVKKMILACGHDVELECWQPAVPSKCRQRCEKLLPCGHTCKERCSAPCTEQCMEPMSSKVTPACNHAVNVPCFERNADLDPYSDYLLSQCSMPCGSILECGHRCSGTCGQCLQGRIHMACTKECGKALICGHRCQVPCSVSCPPCNRKCNMFRCRHSRCSNKCGEPCTPCTEQCGWKCEHMRCTKKCHEICNRKPCIEPCKNILKCGHTCIGFCGEPCPPLCRICDVEQVTTIFFGNEDDEDARFVYLEDCHHVLESGGLEQWMQQSDSEIRMKVCPICTTPITQTQRYLNIVKRVYEDVSNVKRKVFGDLRACSVKRNELSTQLKATVNHFRRVMEADHLKVFNSIYTKLNNELNGDRRKRKGTYSAVDMTVVQIQIQVLSDTAEIAKLASESLNQSSKMKLSAFLHMLLRVLDSRERKISTQEVEDMRWELRRLHRVSQLLVLESEPTFHANINNQEVVVCHREANMLAQSIEKYNDFQDESLKSALVKLKEALKSSVKLTDKERKEIVKAMRLKQGHWYKCPNGHPYVITECGGAMVVSKCNDCGADIGGESHRLLASNAVATEMDGATRPVWPQ